MCGLETKPSLRRLLHLFKFSAISIKFHINELLIDYLIVGIYQTTKISTTSTTIILNHYLILVQKVFFSTTIILND